MNLSASDARNEKHTHYYLVSIHNVSRYTFVRSSIYHPFCVCSLYGMTAYTIIVANQTGSYQNYALFHERPHFTPNVLEKMYAPSASVIAQARVPTGQKSRFYLHKTYYAICGSSQSSESTQLQGVDVMVYGEVPITLGSTSEDVHTPGSSFAVRVVDQALQFDHEKELANGGVKDSFEIKTQNDFTANEAKQNSYMIGYGASYIGKGSSGPPATFIPQPNRSYHITPNRVFYLGYGYYTKDSIISVSEAENLLKVDFANLKADVDVVHNKEGRLKVQVS